jgi:SHAQKYF class myb-like DNA-binding protein
LEPRRAPTLHVRYAPPHAAIMQYGKDWKKVEQYVRTRNGSQVRSHAQKFFNKLQKSSGGQPSGEGQQRRQEHSETEMDFEREANSEVTPSTPIELVSLIKRQEKEEGKFLVIQAA